jgi:tRNA nucleotidyltransferase (CCA-adding enzyme)
MEIYLVGGAVRDRLLGLPVKERDFVVVGSTPQEMLKLGYRPVGKDFPVFLHPKTHEEYALARTERKISKGYTGFEFYADPKVTLEEDLKRRDLTINAIAETLDGRLIDPFNGKQDLENKVLRHVSEAFAEDPVRILRVARFASRFGDFTIHHTTMHLMRDIVKAGEIDALVAERVWQELHRALVLQYPWRFFEVLKDCKALPILFPEIDRPFSQIIRVLKAITALTTKESIRFAALLNCLGQRAIESLCTRVKAPSADRDLALLVNKYQHDFHNALKLNSEKLLTLLEHADAFRRPKRFADFLLACEANSIKIPSQQFEKLGKAQKLAAQVSVKLILNRGFTGEMINKELHQQRKMAIERYCA